MGQYLLAAYFINMALAPHRPEIEVLLDFGCGAGKSTRAVCPSVRPGGKIIGADVPADFLSAAATATYHAIATDASRLLHVGSFEWIKLVVRGDEEQIPLSKNSVNAVTTTIVLQEIQSERLLFSAIKEMGRVAKSGGRLAIAAVSDRITCEYYTAFTYAPFASNKTMESNIRACQSTVSKIVWDHDRHWSKELLVGGFQEAGWVEIEAAYPTAPVSLKAVPECA